MPRRSREQRRFRISSPPAASGWLLAAAVWIAVDLFVACSRSPDDEPPPARDPQPVSAAAPKRAQVFLGWRPDPPSWFDELRRRVDPAVDGWPTESAAALVEARLPGELERWLTEPDPAQRVDAFLAEDFDGASALCPEELATVFDDGHVRVREGDVDGQAERGRDLVASSVASWRAGIGAADRVRVQARVVAAGVSDGGALDTRIALQVAAWSANAALQENVEWSARFEMPDAERPLRAKRIRVTRFQEVRGPRAVLSELTEAVLGGLADYREGMLRGNDRIHGRQDRLNGDSLLGMHGIAVGDVDGDGLEDVYVAQPGGQPNRLLLHEPDGIVRDAGPEAGVAFLEPTRGVLIADLDGDGAQDIACAVAPGVRIAWNDGHGRFPEATGLPVGDAFDVYGLAAADPDGDGDLDLFACRYAAGGYIQGDVPDQVPTPYYDAKNGASDFYWRNEGGRELHDATAEVGLDRPSGGFGLAAAWEDLDGDGDVDLYVTNDFGANSYFRNDGGRFTDVASEMGAADVAASMGVTVADVELDGDPDLVVSNMYAPAGLRITAQPAFQDDHPELRPRYVHHARGNTLLLNRGDGSFSDGTEAARMAPGGWAWGAKFVDLDNDGLEDLYVPNGFITGPRADDLESYFWRAVIAASPAAPPANWTYHNAWDAIRRLATEQGYSWNGRERNYLYWNLGAARFADASAIGGADFDDDARVALVLDWDGDGRLDLVVRNRTGPRVRFLRNDHPGSGSFLEVELVGTASNHDAIGARVEVSAAGRTLRQSVRCGDGYLGSSSRRLHFGLGEATRAERLVVHWPDPGRSTEAFDDVAAGARYRIVQGAGVLVPAGAPARRDAWAAPAKPVEGLREPLARIVLSDRVPMAQIPLGLAGGPRPIGSFAGEVVLIYAGSFADAAGRRGLEGLAARRADLDLVRVRVIPVLFDDAAGLADARGWLAASGLGGEVVGADEKLVKLLQLFLLEILGPFDGLPAPVVLVLDRSGELAFVHCAPFDPAACLEDARLAGSIAAGDRSTAAYLGGSWLEQPSRSFGVIAHTLGLLGRNDLARAYARLAKERELR